MTKRFNILCVEFAGALLETEATEDALKKEGYRVAIVRGEEFLGADPADFDLVLQFGLSPTPGHEDGLRFMSSLQSRFPDIPLWVISGHSATDVVAKEVTKRGASFYMRPVHMEVFLKDIAALSEQKTAE